MATQINKKVIIIAVALLILLLIGAYVFYILFYRQTTSSETGNDQNNGSTIVIKPGLTNGPIPLSREKVLAPTIDSSGKKIGYYSKNQGNMYEVNFDGSNLSRISGANLAGLLQILWSPNKEKIVGVFQENNATTKYLHDYQNGTSIRLNEKIEQVTWSPIDDRIAIQSFNPDANNNVISIANADGTNLKNVFQTRIKDLVLDWPMADKISARTKTSGLSEGLLITINPDSGVFNDVLQDIYGLNARWFPFGDKILYSATNSEGKNIKLFTADQNGQDVKNTELSTLVEKCAFSQDNRVLFCAIPQHLSENAVWPDDYYKGLVTTKDSFWKINLDTGQKTQIFNSGTSAQSYDAIDPFLSPQENYLFFVNKKDGLLYGLKIE
ncbi:MAG: hypothetical protein COT61_04050 [Candidatus Portnoybacteria bacterium CG09_land_8_20_14_0_10_44_13]|uniref:Dipeptidylpeptidase IV N-terminal domain-containing protein n=3 Tax=Candidatus Portnoyibacteriota TaxID=1817913 RepID=A0A2H0WUT4_9BACT|nr:MAG: hypothetical protein AUK17_02480 [Parcubacteria group bacterium CG2_30_44_18]PIS16416.1 MAG: hypothetical protein COT61_04050 [Candidatus Portnoybacteria bacterium CG09_land_8_20_14_0_10_44_13]PIZ71470.1 MAG: hypothetical protein COY11_01335 [Candidatus Portnoybacteria bacterium CG_4_10_14_0_2_um_filter_44_20]PJA62770.1 MAG: hypothetical protein CO161_04735 [Candidatus Portnoybacteria bacterium CG_4_9_14_3_um_filter_44_9]